MLYMSSVESPIGACKPIQDVASFADSIGSDCQMKRRYLDTLIVSYGGYCPAPGLA